MKKAAGLLLALIFIFSISACKKEPEKSSGEIDVDLTSMSNTMVYSEVYNMLNTPEKYVGKRVKMRGVFSMVEGESRNYFTCVISDATACCSQGMEFSLAGEHKYPDDYPELGDNVTVVGEFETYTEGENRFCQVKDAEFV